MPLKKINKETLFEELHNLWLSLESQPSYSEIAQPRCEFHVATYERKNGSTQYNILVQSG